MLIIEIMNIRVPEENPPTSKNSASGKAAIISRMAKMGQSILPKMPALSTTDSEDTEVLLLICLLDYIIINIYKFLELKNPCYLILI